MKLIQLEIKKIALTPYLLASVLIPLVTLAMVNLLAYAPQIDPSILVTDPEMGTYKFLYILSFIINVAGFSCLGTAMLGKVVMESYNDNYLYLTLSYPVARKKILRAKIIFCELFCGFGVFIGILLTNSLFFVSESIFSVVNDSLSFATIVSQLSLMIVAVILVTSISLISLAIGWWRNSLALAIVSSVVFCSIPSNLVTVGGVQVVLAITVILLVASMLVVLLITKKVSRLEA
ncbi:hypothetical protein [Carnobacterium sp.]|uniref:hypothetical protein n=1 Tax=Carnobacterium sp. TaxID=48221 RepID=UPI0038900D57